MTGSIFFKHENYGVIIIKDLKEMKIIWVSFESKNYELKIEL